MVLLFLADLYLWSSVRKQIFSYRKWLKLAVSFIYWLPLILVIGLMAASVFVPIIDWNDQFRTFLLGFILVFYAAKILPVVFLFLADIVRVIDKIFVSTDSEIIKEVVERFDFEKEEDITPSHQYSG